MKKYLLTLIIYILGISNVYALNVSIEDINLSSKSDSVTLGDYSITGNNINTDITFNKLNDYVTYEIKFKDYKSGYTIKDIKDDNNSEYIKTEYNYDKDLSKPIYLTLSYINKTKELSLNNINIVITLLDRNGKEEILHIGVDKSNDIIKIVPNTGISLSIALSIISISLVGYLYFRYYKNKKNISTMILILGLLLIPVSIVVAADNSSLIINISNIKVYNSPWEIVSRSEEGKLSVGDELAVDTEHFYVVSSNEDKTILLAKYNLNVGDNKNPAVSEGIQDESVIGYNTKGKSTYGNVAFSRTNYWYDEKLKYEYGNDFPAYVYDDNCILFQYIEKYYNYIEKLKVKNFKIRLLTYEEALNLGCDNYIGMKCADASEWLYSTSYWLGTSPAYNTVWRFYEGGYFLKGFYSNDSSTGVRPVIEIPTKDI